MGQGESTTVTVRMDRGTLKELDRIATATERSRSSAVRWAVRLLLESNGQADDGQREEATPEAAP